jgi:hypothetical protein
MCSSTALIRAAGLMMVCAAPVVAQTVGDDGTRTMHALRQEPHRAAVCVARNLDRHTGGYVAQIRPGVEPALVEIHVRAAELTALAQFLLAREGSTALIWTAADRAAEREDFVAAMIAGC